VASTVSKMGEDKMKEIEQWEKTQFILAGYKTLCANCRSVPVEKETRKDGIGLRNHCSTCWVNHCYSYRDGLCNHSGPIHLKRN